MPVIHVTTIVHAPAERVFDLCRHRGLYVQCMQWPPQQQGTSKVLGLLAEDELVSWQAKMLGKNRLFRVKLTRVQPVVFMQYEMVPGSWMQLNHQLHFKPLANGTALIEAFSFQPVHATWNPLAVRLLLTPKLRRLLERKNETIKRIAESVEWKPYLQG
jgi:hypothetical protein